MICPNCGANLVVAGSECYPESGLEIECPNVQCDFVGPILIYDKRTDRMKAALVAAWGVLSDSVQVPNWDTYYNNLKMFERD